MYLLPLHPDLSVQASIIHGECFEKAWDSPSMRQLLASHGAFGWITFTEERLKLDQPCTEVTAVGIIICRSLCEAQEAEVLTIGVLPEVRQRGIGYQLVTTTCYAVTSSLFLEVSVDNVAALKLYQKVGFTTVGKRRNYYQKLDGTAADALILQVKGQGGKNKQGRKQQ